MLLTIIKNYSKKKTLALICISLVVIMFTGLFFLMPGFKSLFRNNTITHSIRDIVEIEKDGYTHKILLAYILNERIYLDIFYYKTDVGMTFNLQTDSPVENSDSAIDYWIYYNEKKCNNYSRSYGSAISLSYQIPSAKVGETMVFSLYSGKEFISEIELFPTDSNWEIPYASVNDITLTADVQTRDDQLQVFIRAILPKDAEGNNSLVNQCVSGFSEDTIYIQDSGGNIYRDKSIDSSDEDICMHRLYHIFYFDFPKDIDHFTIIIPQITYKLKNSEFVERYGPWKIEITRQQYISAKNNLHQFKTDGGYSL